MTVMGSTMARQLPDSTNEHMVCDVLVSTLEKTLMPWDTSNRPNAWRVSMSWEPSIMVWPCRSVTWISLLRASGWLRGMAIFESSENRCSPRGLGYSLDRITIPRSHLAFCTMSMMVVDAWVVSLTDRSLCDCMKLCSRKGNAAEARQGAAAIWNWPFCAFWIWLAA